MKVQISQLFGINAPANACIEVGETNHPRIPQADNYVFRDDLLRDVLAWVLAGQGEGLYLTGPTGSGKSSLITQIAARLRVPLHAVNAHSRLETPEMVGRHVVRNGSMVWVDGPLTVAMKEGHWFLLDEFDLLEPATAAGLNNVLEGRPLEIPETGEVVVAHPNFRFVATANTNGAGDSTGLYQGTLQQNIAAMDRFLITEVGYPTKEQEKGILAGVAARIPEQVREAMIKVANDIRTMFMGGESNVTLSTRTLCRWAKYAMFFQGLSTKGIDPLAYSFDRALGFRADEENRKALHEVLQRTFGGNKP